MPLSATQTQKATVEDADEAVDEEQEEDEEVVEENLPWTQSPFTPRQFVLSPSLVEAGAVLNDLKLFIQPCRASGIEHKDPQLDFQLVIDDLDSVGDIESSLTTSEDGQNALLPEEINQLDTPKFTKVPLELALIERLKTPQKTALESFLPVSSPSESVVGKEHCMDASVVLFASAPVKITIVNPLATLALAASKIALLPLPPSTTSTPPSLDYRVPAKDAAGSSTNPNNIVNVPPLDNVHHQKESQWYQNW
ncbi:hypothetical protein K503DRAFT_870677 [Rhizopogon vinicolor AM-OR11-026]|uniref:Uncharacterized protein n=1 Tax=Rhizopogon vinicolor AM-OR11-026 TaxID=1314800 RepID=A0A1B7MFE1_9AGAM|nr:hypothetical protein K503DRAFT_870677 [Rhizopogon vinicolor AM-OR11-026]